MKECGIASHLARHHTLFLFLTKEALNDGNYRDALERGFNAGT